MGNINKKLIMIADDYADSRSMLRYALEMEGYGVVEAVDGSDVLKRIKEDIPSLILMDMAMPVMNGLEATKIIRSMGGKEGSLPILALTAYGQSYYRRAIEAGCDDLLNKPIDPDQLHNVIARYLSGDN